MAETFPYKTTPTTDESTKRSSEKHSSELKFLFLEASKITEETPQLEICKLLSTTATYISNSECFALNTKDNISFARGLQTHLSNCIKSKCDNNSIGFSELSHFITIYYSLNHQ